MFINLGPVVCHAETDKALLCEWFDGHQDWVPRSQMSDECEIDCPGDYGDLLASKWWTEVSGNIAYEYRRPRPDENTQTQHAGPVELTEATAIYRRLAAK